MRKLWLLVSCLVLAAGCFAQPQIIYYKFDETSGAAAKNHAIPGQGWNQGAFSAAPLWNTTTPQIPPAAVNNVGQNRRLNTGYSLAERNGQALTIELWFRTTGTGYQDFVNDSVNFGLWLNNGRIELQTSAGTIQSTNTNNNDGTWRYVAVTRNATNAWTLYWGTTAPGLTSVTGTMANTFTTNAMGLLYWQGASPATYSGEMDEFRLWSVQRTQAELEANRFASFLTQDIDVFDSSNIFVKHQGLAGFTNVASGVASNFTFTIRNMRPAGNVSFTPVTLGSITGATANVTVQPSTIAPGATTTFTIQVTPAQAEFTFTVNINNDRSPNPYTFTFNGMVNTGRPEMLYYRFNEGTGTTTRNDASPGRGNNPATFAAVSWTTTANARLGASAVQATTNLPTGFSCTQLPRPEFTLEFWVWRSGNATTTICGDGTSFRVYRQNATLRIQSGPAGGDQDISTGVNLANNGWTHIAIVSNPGVFGLRVYANGTQAFESINYTFPFANAQLFVMRNGGGTPTSFDGRVDEFRFWAHARTAAQIMADRDREILGRLQVERPAGTIIPAGGAEALGSVPTGAPQTLTYTLRNIGSTGLLLGNPALSFSGATNCSVNVTTNPSGTLLAASATTTAQVQVTPLAAGAFSCQLVFASNDPDVPSYTVNVSGTGVPGEIQIERPAGTIIADNGNDALGTHVAGVPLVLTYTVRNVAATGSINLGAFTVNGIVNCGVVLTPPGATPLAPGGSTTMQATVTPTAAGAFSFALHLANDDLDENPYDINASGTALAPPEINVQRPAGTNIADGGSTAVTGTVAGAGTPVTFTIQNLGGSTLNLTGRSVANLVNCGVALGSFGSSTVAAGGSTTLTVTVTPTAAGAWSFDLDIDSNDSDENPYDIAVSGTALVGGEINVERPAGTTIVDGGSDTVTGTVAGVATIVTYTIRNQGTATLTLTGRNAASLVNCGVGLGSFSSGSLAPGATATLSVSITPVAAGGWSFTLNILSDDLDENPYNIAVSGTATTGAEINVERPSGTTIADGGSDSVSGTVAGAPTVITYTIRNQGSSTLTLTGRSTANEVNCGVALGSFSSTNLAPAATATLAVTITPAAAGFWSFDLDINSNDTDENPYDIFVSGTAAPGGDINVERPAGTTILDGGSDGVTGSIAGAPIVITYTIRNTGPVTLTLTGRSFANNSNCNVVLGSFSSTSLAPSATATLGVTITPIAASGWSFDLDIDSDDLDESPYDIFVSGTAAPGGEINVERPAGTTILDGGSDSVSGTVAGAPTNITYTIRNQGTATLTLTGRSFANNSNCNVVLGSFSSTSLAPSATATLDVTITPIAAGGWSFDLDIDSDDLDEATYDIFVSGTAQVGGEINVERPAGTTILDGGSDTVTGTSAGSATIITYTIRNQGTATLTLTGRNVTSLFNTNVALGAFSSSSLAPAATATLNVAITPLSAGGWSFTLNIFSDDLDEGTYDIAVSGTAVPGGEINVERPAGTTIVDGGSDSVTGTVAGVATLITYTIRNQGTATLTLTGRSFANNSNCNVVLGTFSSTSLAPSATATLNVTITPIAAGAWSFDLDIASDDVDENPYDIAVSGTAAPGGEIDVQRPAGNPIADGGSDSVTGTVSGTPTLITYTIRNFGSADLTLTGRSFANNSNCNVVLGSFSSTNLSPLGTATLDVTITPIAAGGWSFDLDIDSDDLDEATYDIAVSGNALPASSVTGVTVSPDDGGPLRVSATVNGTPLTTIDVVVTYTGGANAGPPVLVWTSTGTISGNTIVGIPANSSLEFVWDAYATERHATDPAYVLTLQPFIGALPGAPGLSPPFALSRDGGWAKHLTPGEQSVPLFGHVAVFDAANDRMVIFGGRKGSIRSNETWVYQRGAAPYWRRIYPAGTTPAGRQYAAAVYDAAGQRMIVFGGFGNSGALNDAWQLSLGAGTETWTQIAAASPGIPAARYGHSLVLDAGNNRVLMHGGLGSTYLNDTWALDLGTSLWGAAAISTGGPGRNGHAAVLDAAGNRMVVYGGHTTAGTQSDVWQMNLTSLAWSAVSTTGTPGARYFSSYLHDTAANRLITCSGYNGSTVRLDGFILDLQGPNQHVWTPLAQDEIAATGRVQGSAVMDPARLEGIFYGGLNVNTQPMTGLSILALGAVPVWTPPASVTAYPAARWGAVMVHDTFHDRLVLWGGKDASSYFGDVWVLDRSVAGAAWQRLSVTGSGPATRVYAAGAYDALNRRLLISGGQDASGVRHADLWSLDLSSATGASWTQHAAGGPAGRIFHTLVYDSVLDRAVLFGGLGTTNYNDVWIFDFAAPGWVQHLPGLSPDVRQGHGAIYDAVRQRMVIFAGRNSLKGLNDVWALDLNPAGAWTNISQVGGTPMNVRSHFAWAANAAATSVWIHSGNGAAADLWHLDLGGTQAAWAPVTLPGGGPGARTSHNAVMDGNDLLVGFGLEAGAGVRDLWRLDVTNPSAGWQLAGAPLQPPGLVHSHVERDAANHRLIAFGGFLAGANDGELWQLDLNAVRPAWARLAVTGPRPGPRRTGTMVYDAAGGRMILYGGRTGIANSTITDEVWALDLTPGSEQWTLLTTSGASPGRRAQHVAVLAGPGRMVIFGGASETGAIQNTTFELNLNTLVWSQIAAANAPLPRLAAAAVYDPAGQRMLLYGGLNGGALGTFHALNLTGAPVWTTLTKTGTAPPSLYYHSMVYDAALHRVLLFGGFGSEAANGLYVLDVATLVWSLTAPPVAQPQRRWGHGAVWDPVGARMVMVGGFIDGEIPAVDSDGFADTWFWGD
ncbi:MAG: choice-of-anchor D domain-containing protein [Planctomycetes bacterium]|nr:choice-of-anchor D domain-containing protein [Planctomycetota bacterium]